MCLYICHLHAQTAIPISMNFGMEFAENLALNIAFLLPACV